uniref:Uncharacterized protein n=1 Tax=Arundo donax TaxID=35708 RepID=A0A0A9CG18_ARUDO
MRHTCNKKRRHPQKSVIRQWKD